MFITTEGGGGPTTAPTPDQSLSRLLHTPSGDGGRTHCWWMMMGEGWRGAAGWLLKIGEVEEGGKNVAAEK